MAPTFALQNERTGDFVVGHGPAVRVFNGSAGTETAVFRSGAADLTCGAFDLRGRKLAVADQAGSVRVLNMMNGAVLKQQQVHRGEVTSIHYCSVDNIIISTGYDRRIAVMDEDSPDALPILRTVDGASPDPISCSTYHRQLSLIVIGSASGELRVFDMQDLKPLIVHAAHAQDIAALISLPDRAVLFSTDLGATVSMWQIVDRQELRSLGTFHNLAPPPSPPPSPGKDGDEDGDFSFLTGPSEACVPFLPSLLHTLSHPLHRFQGRATGRARCRLLACLHALQRRRRAGAAPRDRRRPRPRAYLRRDRVGAGGSGPAGGGRAPGRQSVV